MTATGEAVFSLCGEKITAPQRKNISCAQKKPLTGIWSLTYSYLDIRRATFALGKTQINLVIRSLCRTFARILQKCAIIILFLA